MVEEIQEIANIINGLGALGLQAFIIWILFNLIDSIIIALGLVWVFKMLVSSLAKALATKGKEA